MGPALRRAPCCVSRASRPHWNGQLLPLTSLLPRHAGNILLARGGGESDGDGGDSGYVRARLRGQSVRARSGGLTATIIDFSLSRLEAPGVGALHFDLETDEAIFKGPARDFQADTYRRMRKLTRGDWAGFHPGTNGLWLAYLADTLLERKRFSCSADERKALRDFRKSALNGGAGVAAAELLWADLFKGQWVAEGA